MAAHTHPVPFSLLLSALSLGEADSGQNPSASAATAFAPVVSSHAAFPGFPDAPGVVPVFAEPPPLVVSSAGPSIHAPVPPFSAAAAFFLSPTRVGPSASSAPLRSSPALPAAPHFVLEASFVVSAASAALPSIFSAPSAVSAAPAATSALFTTSVASATLPAAPVALAPPSAAPSSFPAASTAGHSLLAASIALLPPSAALNHFPTAPAVGHSTSAASSTLVPVSAAPNPLPAASAAGNSSLAALVALAPPPAASNSFPAAQAAGHALSPLLRPFPPPSPAIPLLRLPPQPPPSFLLVLPPLRLSPPQPSSLQPAIHPPLPFIPRLRPFRPLFQPPLLPRLPLQPLWLAFPSLRRTRLPRPLPLSVNLSWWRLPPPILLFPPIIPSRLLPSLPPLFLPTCQLLLRLLRPPSQPSRTSPHALIPSFLSAYAHRSQSTSPALLLCFLMASALSCLVRAGRSRGGCTNRSRLPRHSFCRLGYFLHPGTLFPPLRALSIVLALSLPYAPVLLLRQALSSLTPARCFIRPEPVCSRTFPRSFSVAATSSCPSSQSQQPIVALVATAPFSAFFRCCDS